MKLIIAHSRSNKSITGVVTIPVVIHIVHRGEPIGVGVNISEAQASSIIGGLNRDFRASPVDGGIAQRGPSALNADCQIQFCLAKTDPNGNPTSGITRVNGSSVSNYSNQGVQGPPPFNVGATPASITNLRTWDVNQYLNIWVVSEIGNGGQDNPGSFSGGVLGFAPATPSSGAFTPAQIETATGGYAGLFVCAIGCFNDPSNANPGWFKLSSGFDQAGRIATHEIGHYFGLPHTFDDFNPTTCSNGDGIGDTPPAINGLVTGDNNICLGALQCSGQHKNNYMDYGNNSCIGAYTPGQKTVMRNVLGGGFISLTQGDKCDAAFDLSIDNATISQNNCDLTFDASVSITNAGLNTLTQAKLRYRINGGAFVNYTWTGSLTSGNSTTFNLPGLVGANGANTFLIEVRTPNTALNNNKSDQERANDSQSKSFMMDQPTPVSVSASATTICSGESVSLTASGSNSYSWNQSLGSGASKSDSPTSTKNYIVTGTTSGCATTANVQVTVNSLPSASIGSVVNETCQNQNGSISVTASGGQSGYEYSLDNGAYVSSSNFSNLDDGSYSIRVKDANGCVSSAETTSITNSGGFSSSITSSADICIGESSIITVTAPPSGITYTWDNGLSSVNQHSVSPTSSTTYNVTISDGICTKNESSTITVNSLPSVSANASSISVCTGSNLTLTGAGASTYTWDNGVTDGVSFVPSTTKTYTVTGTDVNGCVKTSNVTVSVNSLPNVSGSSNNSIVCSGDNIILSGAGASTYTWDNGATNGVSFPIMSTTTFTVTGTDGNGCSNTANTSVTVNQLPSVTANTTSNSICNGENITLTGGGASSYTWNNSVSDGISFSPTSTITYTVTGTDGNNCINTADVLVTVNQLPSVSANASSITVCSGDNLTLTGSGASTYSWDNSVTDGTSFVPSSTTTYTVTGTDVNGCIKASNVTVTVNSLPTVLASSSSNSICIGDNVTLSGAGASSYVWDNSVTDGAAFSPTSTTTYTVTGTDANGCVDTESTTIVVNQLPLVTANTTNDSVCVGSDVTLTGGGASTYVWNNGVSDGVAFSPTSTSTYTVTGTDANGCVNQDMISLESLPSPTVTMSLSEVTLCKDETVDVSASGATSYSWVTNDLTPSVTLTYPESFDSLSVYGIDANGRCSTYYAIPFNQSNMETSITPGFSLCEGDQAPITVSNLGGVGLQYEWNNGLSNANSHSISPRVPTTYDVVVTDSYGCDDTLSTIIDVIAAPNLTLSANSLIFCSGDEEDVTASGADEYVWDTGDTTSMLHLSYPIGVDSIVVTGINNGLCHDTKVISISESFMSNSLTDSTAICSGDIVEVGVETNDPSVTFTWDNGLPSIASHSLSPTITTTYNVSLVDSLGCEENLVTEVLVVPLPQLTLSLADVILCEGDEVSVTVSGADAYSWNTGDTLSSLTLSYPTGLDTLKVIGINGGACINESSIPIEQSIIDATIIDDQTICEGGSVSLLVVSNNSTLNYNWNQGLGNSNFHSVSPMVTTNYEVELIDDLGCKDTLTTVVQVDLKPNLTVTPNFLKLCFGEEAVLTADGATNYNWSSGNNNSTETITASSNTTINLVGMNGVCSQSLSIPVQVDPIPTAVISSNTTSVNTGGAIQFYNTGSIANNYVWDFGDGSSNSTFANPYHTFAFSGAYIVQLTGFQGECQSTDSLLVYVGTVGLSEYENTSIMVYPNPTSGIINLEISEELNSYEVLIYNNLGALVQENDDITIFNNKIDLISLPNGTYYLKAISANDSKVFQIQIIH